MNQKTQNLTQAGAVLLLSSVIVKLIGALFKIPLSADYALGDLGFGYFSSCYDMYLPLYTLALSGFPVAIARAVASFSAKENLTEIKKVLIISFKALSVLGLSGSFLLIALSIPLVSLIDNSGGSLYSILCIAPSVLFCCISSVFRGYFEGKKNMLPTAVSNIIEALCKLTLGLGGAVITTSLTHNPALASAAAMLGIAFGTALSSLYLWLTFKREELGRKIRFTDHLWDTKLFKNLTALALPIAFASLSVGLASLIDALTVRYQISSLLAESPTASRFLLEGTFYGNIDTSEIPTLLYGIKGKAHTLFNLVPTLTSAFGIGALPIITESFTKNNKSELQKNCNLCLKLSSVIAMPAAGGLLVMGKEIISLLYGDASSGLGGRLLSIYGIAALFCGIAVPLTSLLQAIGKQKIAFINIIIGLVLKLIFNIALTPIETVNILGSAISAVICFAFICIFNIMFLIKYSGINIDFKSTVLKPFTASIVCCVTAYFVNLLSNSKLVTLCAITFAAAVYLFLLWLLKVITREEIYNLKKIG